MHLAPRGLQHLVDGFVQQFQVLRFIDQAGATQKQVVVVTGEAFEEPQQLGVVLLLVVVARERVWAQALDIPGVKVFVADQTQQGGVAFAAFLAHAGQVVAIANQGGRVAVLQAPVAIAHGPQHEDIACVRRLAFAVPETNLGFAYFLAVGDQARAIEGGRRTGHHKFMGDAASLESGRPEVAHFNRAVDQLIVVGGEVAAKAALVHLQGLQAGGQTPSWRRHAGGQTDFMGLIFLPLHLKEQARAIEEAAQAVEPRSAHRSVVRMDLPAQREWVLVAAVDAPTGFVQLRHRAGAARLAGVQAAQLFGKFAHQVTASNPHRQAHHLLRSRPCNRQFKVKLVGVGVQLCDTVVQTTSHQVPPAPNRQAKVDTTVRRKRSVSQSRRPASGQVLRSTR